MSGAEIGIALSVFLACSVEAVEALTIVLAVGVTRSWSSALSGVCAAVIVLAAIVVALGPALTALPIDVLRVVVGGLLLVFGLQWLRKAVLREAGLKDKHDELRIYAEETEAAREAARAAGGRRKSFDGYAFTIAFKGVLLEGLEVAFIVLTVGTNQGNLGLAAVAAGVAVLVVVTAGIAARAPLARVPENTMKLAVGVMLSSFGMFWGAEGAGAHWPGDDVALLAIVPAVLLMALALVAALRRVAHSAVPEQADELTPSQGNELTPSQDSELTPSQGNGLGAGGHMPRTSAFLRGVWEFVVGEDWRTALGVVVALGLTAILAGAGSSAWWVMPVAVPILLALSVRRAARGYVQFKGKSVPLTAKELFPRDIANS